MNIFSVLLWGNYISKILKLPGPSLVMDERGIVDYSRAVLKYSTIQDYLLLLQGSPFQLTIQGRPPSLQSTTNPPLSSTASELSFAS
jgi:hypothetical protein